MDLNEQLKDWLMQQAQPGSFLDKAGLGLAQAGQTIGQDAAAGAAIMNDPRNSWIGMNPLGKAVSGGLGLVGMLSKGPGKYAQFGLPESKAIGQTMQDLAAGPAQDMISRKFNHLNLKGYADVATDEMQRYHDDPLRALHQMVENQLGVGRATGTGLEHPKSPIQDFVKAFPDTDPQELGALIKMHYAYKPGFYERLMTPEALELLMLQADEMMKGSTP